MNDRKRNRQVKTVDEQAKDWLATACLVTLFLGVVVGVVYAWPW